LEEKNGSKLTIGTQSVFCGTGIRALRDHQLQRDEEDDANEDEASGGRTARSDPQTHSAWRASSRRSSVEEARASRASLEMSAESLAQAEKQHWSREYADILQQLKAVKLEEAWEGHDSFADMEMGFEPIPEPAHEEPPVPRAGGVPPPSVPAPLRRRPGRASGGSAGDPSARRAGPRARDAGLSSSAGADILTLEHSSKPALDGSSEWRQAHASLRASPALVEG
jgi:hypothetical protein